MSGDKSSSRRNSNGSFDLNKYNMDTVNSLLNDDCGDIPEEVLRKIGVDDQPIDGFDFDTAEEFLLYHSRVGNLTVVEKLLLLMKKQEIELNVNCKGQQKSNFGWTSLHLACYFGHAKVVQELLKYNANVNVINEQGDTPLHKAAYTGRDEIVVILLANNADVFITNGDGLTPREVASKESVRRILLAAEEADMKKKEEKFLSAARNGDINTMKILLADTTRPIEINCQDESGNTALHCAAYRSQKEVAVFLLKNGIDTGIKNKRGQIAAYLAPNLQMKQLLQEVKSVPAHVVHLRKKALSRHEGLLLKKGKFLGWRPIWAVLDRGVFSFFANRADATTGTRRKGYKYLESAIVDASSRDDTSFMVYFSDRSRTQLSLPNANPSQIDREKWIRSFNDHIFYATNLIRQGMRLDDSDEDDLGDLMPMGSMQEMIQTAQAHQSILEKHIKALMLLSEEINSSDKQITSSGSHKLSDSKSNNLTTNLFENILPSLKFHLNLILESSNNASASLSNCMAVLNHQDKLRQLQLKQEQEKVRVLEDALHVLARQHHDLEQSVANSVPYFHSSPRTHSICMSDTDIEEYFDAFDDADDSNETTLCEDDNDDKSSSLATLTCEYQTPQVSIHESIHELNDDIEKEISQYGRTSLPSVMVPRDEVSLWSILKHCIGKELSKITFPVVFNEPLSFLQRVTENFEYSHYLNDADDCEDPVERMENVCAFFVSGLSSNAQRMNKPFNPLLGETFEYESEELGVKIVCEQVSHHPPVSAFHAESDHFQIYGSIYPKLKFWGKSIEIRPEGTTILKLKKSGEIFSWKTVNCCVHNIIVGKLWIEQYGAMEIINHTNGMRASVNFKAAGWFGRDLHRLEGFIYSKDNEKLRFIYGKWTDYLKSVDVQDYNDYMKTHAQQFRVPDKPSNGSNSMPNTPKRIMSKFNNLTKQFTTSSTDMTTDITDDHSNLPPEGNNGEIPKSDSSDSLDIPNSRFLWQVEPNRESKPQYYHFTMYTMALNQLDEEMKKSLPPTDSRLRPDVRKLEEGDLEAAASEKNRLEEKQREIRKIRKKRRESWSPLWFNLGKNPFTKEEEWVYGGEYWDRDYSKCSDIY